MIQGAEQYARFLAADRGIPLHLGSRIGGFMLTAGRCTFCTRAGIWHKETEDGRHIARVYFTPWSQNRRAPLRGRMVPKAAKWYFDASDAEVWIDPIWIPRFKVSDYASRLKCNGRATREAFDEFKEKVTWLKRALGSTS